jgi:hypothetical protein
MSIDSVPRFLYLKLYRGHFLSRLRRAHYLDYHPRRCSAGSDLSSVHIIFADESGQKTVGLLCNLETRFDTSPHARPAFCRNVNIGSTWFVDAWLPEIETAWRHFGRIKLHVHKPMTRVPLRMYITQPKPNPSCHLNKTNCKCPLICKYQVTDVKNMNLTKLKGVFRNTVENAMFYVTRYYAALPRVVQ